MNPLDGPLRLPLLQWAKEGYWEGFAHAGLHPLYVILAMSVIAVVAVGTFLSLSRLVREAHGGGSDKGKKQPILDNQPYRTLCLTIEEAHAAALEVDRERGHADEMGNSDGFADVIADHAAHVQTEIYGPADLRQEDHRA
jgi:hypothetical protein